MQLRFLGRTGIRVSELCLGTMNFGVAEWGIGERESIELVHAYLADGGNFIDTADVYSGGISEDFCAKALAGRRDAVILATKGHFPVTRKFGEPPVHDNALGSSRRHLTTALNDSLRRLRTDYIDLYQVHCWDEFTPIEETLATLDDFVRSGKVRYVGLSNYTAWQIAESHHLGLANRWTPFVTAQMQYSLICRDVERGVVPVCRRHGLGLLPWSPLGGGVLTGKYGRDLTGPAGSRFGDKADPGNDWRAGFVNERALAVSDEVKAVAARHATSSAAVALTWLLGRPAVDSVIVGPRSIEQWRDQLAACKLQLSPEDEKRLDEVSRPMATYPEQFIQRTGRNRSA